MIINNTQPQPIIILWWGITSAYLEYLDVDGAVILQWRKRGRKNEYWIQLCQDSG